MLQDGSSAEVMAEFEHDGSDSELDPLERDELKAPWFRWISPWIPWTIHIVGYVIWALGCTLWL